MPGRATAKMEKAVACFAPRACEVNPAPGNYQEQGPSLSSHLALVRSTGSVEPAVVE